MESLITLLKIFLYMYLGLFTYIIYQIFFSFQKRFLILKTFYFFILLSILIIKISNKYSATFFLGYMFFYLLGIYISKTYFYNILFKNIKVVKHFIINPLKKYFFIFLKYILLYDLFLIIKTKIKLQLYYHKYPHKKPKSIYELFWQHQFIML